MLKALLLILLLRYWSGNKAAKINNRFTKTRVEKWITTLLGLPTNLALGKALISLVTCSMHWKERLDHCLYNLLALKACISTTRFQLFPSCTLDTQRIINCTRSQGYHCKAIHLINIILKQTCVLLGSQMYNYQLMHLLLCPEDSAYASNHNYY